MNLGMPEIIIILLIVLLLFGPKKLPELARGLGQSVREFKKGANDIKQEFEQVVNEEPAKPEPQAAAPAEKKAEAPTEQKPAEGA